MTKIIFLYQNFRSGHIFQKVQGQKSKKFDQCVPWILSFRSKTTIFGQKWPFSVENDYFQSKYEQNYFTVFSKILRVTLTMLSDCIMNLYKYWSNAKIWFDTLRYEVFHYIFREDQHFRSVQESLPVRLGIFCGLKTAGNSIAM